MSQYHSATRREDEKMREGGFLNDAETKGTMQVFSVLFEQRHSLDILKWSQCLPGMETCLSSLITA